MNTVVLEEVSKEYASGQVVLEDVSIEFDAESINLIIGRSGAGKTTLIRLLLGVMKPTRGRVLINDVDISQMRRSDSTRYRKHVGLISQASTLVQTRTVNDNVALPLWISGASRQDIQHRVQASLRIVGLEDSGDILPNRLSSGEQQRVAIARAIVHRPKLLVADEPTGNLDKDLALEVLGLFELFPDLGTTVIVATHDQNLVSRGHRVLELVDGSFIQIDLDDE